MESERLCADQFTEPLSRALRGEQTRRVRPVKPDKEVILMARQCGVCGRARAGALHALLSNPSLKVFSRLVVDAATARELLKDKG